MPRHIFTKEDCSKGGRNATKEAKKEAGKKGFEVTCETHPFFARHWLQYCKGMKKANGTKPVRSAP